MVCGILVPQPRIKLVPCTVEAQRPNHWTTREVPYHRILDIIGEVAFQGFLWAGISQGLWNLTNSSIHLSLYSSIHPSFHPSIHLCAWISTSICCTNIMPAALGEENTMMIKRGASSSLGPAGLLEMFRWVSLGQLIFKNHAVVWASWHLAILWTRKCLFPCGSCLVPGSGKGIGWRWSAKWKRLGVSHRCSGWVCKWKFPR